MIQIRNITKGRPNEARTALRTNWGAGTAAFPISIDLSPGETLEIPAQSLNDWDPGVKEFIAEYMANGIFKVFHIDSVHIYQAKNHNASYDLDYLIPARYGDLALNHAVAVGASLNEEMDLHFADNSVHDTAPVGDITAATPTDLATLLTWIADAQAEYTTHVTPAGGAHPNADAVNVVTLGAPGTLATAIAALQELHRIYHSHKKWYDNAIEMDINAVLTY